MNTNKILEDLAVFRWTARLNIHKGIANHFSVCLPDSSESFYVNGTGMHFSKIKTNNYIKSLNILSVNTIIGNRKIYASSMREGKTAIEKPFSTVQLVEGRALSITLLADRLQLAGRTQRGAGVHQQQQQQQQRQWQAWRRRDGARSPGGGSSGTRGGSPGASWR